MTTVVRQHHNSNYYISLEIKEEYNMTYYEVQACPANGDSDLVGYPEHSMVYSMDEKRNAYATFNRYKRKYV